MPEERYTHGHHAAVVGAHATRTAATSAAFLLPHLQRGQQVLDVGCGPGSITVDLAVLVEPGEVTGVDRAEAVLAAARALAVERDVTNVRFEQANVYELPYAKDSFDVVHAHQLLQHLVRPVDALVEMRRVVRRGGVVAVRDADYATMIHAPNDPRLDRWLELYHQVARANEAEPDAGRHLRSWMHRAGLTEETTTATAWCYADATTCTWWAQQWASRVTEGSFADQALEQGFATAQELGDIATAWLQWAARPDAFFSFLNGEVLGRKR